MGREKALDDEYASDDDQVAEVHDASHSRDCIGRKAGVDCRLQYLSPQTSMANWSHLSIRYSVSVFQTMQILFLKQFCLKVETESKSATADNVSCVVDVECGVTARRGACF